MPIEKQKAPENPIPGRRALGLLLSQLGTHAALSFGRKIAGFGISPPHFGILRWIHANEGKNQRELASHLGVVPSRLVVLLDELETKGLVARERSAAGSSKPATAIDTKRISTSGKGGANRHGT